ncbi:uncharacterized protein LY79DRAFT_568297 [Colletotrichum navitas]|uniref:Uncharacterized protein n=1 Tax=Colletotrichum navitas TaxID=681940 RepID=A0AAD8PPN1_9PEZI|nr:uncharacterized protein LY79DRAFT_568297 [Colletotrichum navitas]KAK1573621.1 hypothetical protein LY79DRAFT_568297 [Colletotrichum navitas]
MAFLEETGRIGRWSKAVGEGGFSPQDKDCHSAVAHEDRSGINARWGSRLGVSANSI